MNTLRRALLAAALLCAGVPGGVSLAAQDEAAGGSIAGVRVEDAWARATVEGQEGSGAYLRITSDLAARLVGVRSPVAREVQIHLSKVENGLMTMRRQDAVDLPAGTTVSFGPRGLHLMLLGLNRVLSPGQGVPLTLVLEVRGARKIVPVTARVRGLGQ